MSNDFGIRGRTPKYRFDLYGPHSSDWFDVLPISLSSTEESAKALVEQMLKESKVHANQAAARSIIESIFRNIVERIKISLSKA